MRKITLEAFRRHPEPVPDQQASENLPTVISISAELQRSEEWLEVERAVRAVLDDRVESALKAIAEAEDPKDKQWIRTLPKFSVADICKSAGKSRSAIYEYHKDFVTDAFAAKDTVDKALADRVWSFRRQTKTGLKERLAIVEAQLEQERAKRASEPLTRLIERLGPFAADRQRASAELQQIRDENAHLREQLQQAREQNRKLSILLNSGGKL
jgi:hypothetical protein